MERDEFYRNLLDNINTAPRQNVITAGYLYRLRDSMNSTPLPTPIIEYDAYHHRYIGTLGDIHCDHQLLGMEDAEERAHIQQLMRENVIHEQARRSSNHILDATRYAVDMKRIELQALQDRVSAATIFAEHRELEARRNTVRTQLQIA